MAQPNHAHYTTYDPDETPRPPRPKRFKDDKLNHIADQLVAPTNVFNQYAAQAAPHSHQLSTQQHRYPTNRAYNKQQNQQPHPQPGQLPNTHSRNPSGTLPTPKAIMDKRHPSSFQQLEKVCDCLQYHQPSC